MYVSLENGTPLVDAPTADQHRPGQRGRVLVAEDAMCVQRSADVVISQMHLDADVAEDGRIACHMAKVAKAEGRPYDLILMDMQMPNMDGVEATQWLRQNHWTGPIVAVSVHVGERNRVQCLVAGCDDFIAKPLTDKKLRETLARLAIRYDGIAQIIAMESEMASADDKQPTLHGRLLIAEDARCIQMVVRSLLRKLNLEADTADNGQIACDMAVQSQRKGIPYDVILMDMQMPKMNGRQATRWLRDNGWQKPIIAVSIHATDHDHKEFLKAGCNAYVSKPVTESSLRNVLSQYLPSA